MKEHHSEVTQMEGHSHWGYVPYNVRWNLERSVVSATGFSIGQRGDVSSDMRCKS